MERRKKGRKGEKEGGKKEKCCVQKNEKEKVKFVIAEGNLQGLLVRRSYSLAAGESS